MKWYLLVIQPAWACLRFICGSSRFVQQPLSSHHTQLIPVISSRSTIKSLAAVLTLAAGLLLEPAPIRAQQTQAVSADTTYWKVVSERAVKIVEPLALTSSEKKQRVITEIASQYVFLNRIHDGSKATATSIRSDSSLSKTTREEALKKEEDKKMALLKQQHDLFIAHLQKDLTAAEIEKVKDGLTYSVLPKTYAATLEMIPTLTDPQKKQVYAWLEEAREYAMDAESSDKKHWWFGKYKGRINNYLSAQGYDLQKEREGWAKRIKEKEKNSSK